MPQPFVFVAHVVTEVLNEGVLIAARGLGVDPVIVTDLPSDHLQATTALVADYFGLPDKDRRVEALEDPRLWCESSQALEQMFVTISLQLNVAPLIEHPAAMPEADASPLRRLLEDDLLDAKYLLTAGTLASKASTGAQDISKFYGRTAPNFLEAATSEADPSTTPSAAVREEAP